MSLIRSERSPFPFRGIPSVGIEGERPSDLCVKKYGSLGTGRTVDNVDLTLANELHTTVMVFDDACTLLIGIESDGGLLLRGHPHHAQRLACTGNELEDIHLRTARND